MRAGRPEATGRSDSAKSTTKKMTSDLVLIDLPTLTKPLDAFTAPAWRAV
jgi:hypothetical protein